GCDSAGEWAGRWSAPNAGPCARRGAGMRRSSSTIPGDRPANSSWRSYTVAVCRLLTPVVARPPRLRQLSLRRSPPWEPSMTRRLVTLVLLLVLHAATTQGAEPHWIGTWATAAQGVMPGRLETFDDQTVRLIVHVSAGGKRVRVRLSNVFGDRPLVVRAAHIARRTRGAE